MTSPLDPYKASLDKLEFDDEAKARMASNLRAAAATRIVEFPKNAAVRRPKRRLALAAACLAAALAIGGGGGVAVAAGVLPNPADVLSDVFGGAPAQTELLNEVGRPIGASATSNGVTVTAEAVAGDRSNFTVVYDVEFDDPSVLEGIEPGEDGTLPLVADATRHVDGVSGGGGGSWFYDADPGDGTIQYAETMGFTTWNGAGIVGRTMRFWMSEIRAYDAEGGYTTLVTGNWSLKFEMNYVDTTVDLPAGQETAWQGAGVTVDAVAVSSVGVTVDYTIDRQVGDLGPSGKLSDEARAKQEAVTGLPVAVTFADGTTFDATNANTHSQEQGDGTSAVTKTATYDRIVAASDIVSVTVGDVEIPVSAA
ncbi:MULTISPECIES: DUF4179 domain-containing protein [Gordonibacter]|uniref:DUF4179 domain-containing protein n=1 Tax=Gordonibacter faecis TaxID=3047475 RepID=A0ABT7DKJ2_9ACTN|nr:MULTISPECIES: DUF4179 domain-containing protein [unclassified Gordonibacter]MDJ1650053.1 DUF4179 domain-containing protein [Gordonibacter sp. KGMB12511]